MSVFAQQVRDRFAGAYPETPHALRHGLHDHRLLELESLARLADALPAGSVEAAPARQAVGVEGKPPPPPGPPSALIRDIGTSDAWVVLKNIEQHPAYAALLAELLDELRPAIEVRTGAMLKTQAFVFISAAHSVTPYHFDPEHNVLLQLRGTKAMTQFPAGDPAFAPDRVHESYHTGGARELPWGEEMLAGGTTFVLHPGDAVYVPVMAPHFVRNGAEPSLSLSITWRSAWSFEEADARAFNGLLRRFGAAPASPGRWPSRNRAKALGWRIARRFSRAADR